MSKKTKKQKSSVDKEVVITNMIKFLIIIDTDDDKSNELENRFSDFMTHNKDLSFTQIRNNFLNYHVCKMNKGRYLGNNNRFHCCDLKDSVVVGNNHRFHLCDLRGCFISGKNLRFFGCIIDNDTHIEGENITLENMKTEGQVYGERYDEVDYDDMLLYIERFLVIRV